MQDFKGLSQRQIPVSSTFITDHDQKEKVQTIFKIEEAQLPMTFDDNPTELPNKVEFKKIRTNVLNSIKYLTKIPDQPGKLSSYDRWQKYIDLPENQAVVVDCFWYVVAKYFKKDEEILPKLLSRISKNYINLFLAIDNKKDNNLFFKTYFDILSQSVFYSLFYSFPLSRQKFKDQLKINLLDDFSYLFTGIKISNTNLYIREWNLDLGAGNIFKMELEADMQKKREIEQNLPPIELSATAMKARNKRTPVPIKFSPIVEIYLRDNKYATRNSIQGFKMKFTEIEKNQDEIELKFTRYLKLAESIKVESEKMKNDNKEKGDKMKRAIKEIKLETVKHQKRLQKRKAEELERGGHEYANYLVSMLNHGITIANLGVSKQK